MVNPEEAAASSEPAAANAEPMRDIPERSAGSAIPAPPQGSASTATRPRQVAGNYPMRQVTYYQFSTSDIRSIGFAQAAATICAAIGTFALSGYLEFNKDIALAQEAGQPTPEFLETITNLSFWAWLVFWGVAVLAFVWQGNELRRVKVEHGELTLLEKFQAWWSNRGTR